MFEMEAFVTEVRPNYKSRVVLVMSIFYQEMLTINRLSCVGVRMCTYTYTNSFCSRHTPEMIENTFPIILRLTGRRWSPALLFCAELTMKQRGGKKETDNLSLWPHVMCNILNYGVSTNLRAAAMAAKIFCCQNCNI